MSNQRRNDFLIPLLTVVSDVCALELAFLLSYWLRFYSQLTSIVEVTQGIPPLGNYIVTSFLFIPVWLFIFQSRELYTTRRNTHISDELFAIIRIISIGMLILMSTTFFYREFSYSRAVFVLIWLTAIVTVTTGRYFVMRFEQSLYKRGRELKTVAIVGNNTTANSVFTHLTENKSLGYEIIGYYAKMPADELLPLARSQYLGAIKNLPMEIAKYRLQAALISLSYKEHPQLYELIRDAEGLNIDLMMVPDMLDLMTSRVRIQDIEGLPFIKIKEIPLSTWNKISKRTFDIIVSFVILILASPLMVLICILIKATSRGPIFYIQERVGLDGISFPIIKFRSMHVNAEASTGPVRNTKSDNRSTPVGKLLRRTSFDELPQLWNVLLGHMSIVGPRPERPYFVAQFKEKIPRYLERHRMKSGMTGWAQVNGLRGNAPIEERTKFDVYYIENWSIVFDIKIILKTIYAVIVGKDAY